MGLNYLIKRVRQERLRRFLASVVATGVAGILGGVALAAVAPLLRLVRSGGQAVVATGRLGSAIQGLLDTGQLPFNLATVLALILMLVGRQSIALGQRLVISDILVHREQDVPGATYFAPEPPAALAEQVTLLLAAPRLPDAEAEARLTTIGRAREFGERFYGICAEAAGGPVAGV